MKKDYFHLDQIDHQELLYLLLAHFTTSNGFRFQRPGTEHYLEVSFGKDEKIRNIQKSKDFPRKELEEIEKDIRDNLLTDHGNKIKQIVCFCHSKVLGYFRYKDLFQILPMPIESPTPPFSFADHPFILEVSYKYSPIPMVNICRWKEKEVIYTRLLNLFLYQAISTGSRYGQSAWVIKENRPSEVSSEWMQLGYVTFSLEEPLDDFSSVEGISSLEKKPFQDYYATSRIRVLTPLVIPDNLEYSFNRVFSLPPPLWRKFFIACTWFAQYRYTVKESSSSAFIALVTSLESLVKDVEPNTCPECGQSRYSVMKRFKDLIFTYFPMIDQFPTEKKMLYNVRSQLAHGLDLLQSDLEPWKLLYDTRQEKQEKLQFNLYFITGIVIYNWLCKSETLVGD